MVAKGSWPIPHPNMTLPQAIWKLSGSLGPLVLKPFWELPAVTLRECSF